MLNLTAKVTINGRIFTAVSSIKVTTSVEDFMDTATLVMPQYERGTFKEGDEVNILLGYEDLDLQSEFFGNINEISPASPYEIRCLDPFNELRKKYLLRSFYHQKVSKIAQELLRGTGYSLDSSLDPSVLIGLNRIITLYAVTNDGYKNLPMTVRKAFQRLAIDNGYICYFEGRRLKLLDRKIESATSQIPLFVQGESIIENSLLYNQGNTVKKVTVFSESKGGIPLRGSWVNNKVKDSSIEKNFDVSGFSSDGDCIRRAKEISDQLNAPGYTGDFKTFGYPFVRAGQFCAIKMKNQEAPTIQAVKKTEMTFDSGGFRRIITPSSIANDVMPSNPLFRYKKLNYFNMVAA